jgi:hypothetical protein
MLCAVGLSFPRDRETMDQSLSRGGSLSWRSLASETRTGSSFAPWQTSASAMMGGCGGTDAGIGSITAACSEAPPIVSHCRM